MKTTIYSVQRHFQTSRNPEIDWQQEEIQQLQAKNQALTAELQQREQELELYKRNVVQMPGNPQIDRQREEIEELKAKNQRFEDRLFQCFSKLEMAESLKTTAANTIRNLRQKVKDLEQELKRYKPNGV